MKWRINSPKSIHIKHWGDEAVVYDTVSGNTHLVGAAAAHILAQILASPSDAGTLTQALFPTEEQQPVNDAMEKVESILAQLADIALISSATP